MGEFNNKSDYEIFNLDETSSIQELKIAYAKLVKKYKPTHYPVEFQELNQAYHRLLKVFQDEETSSDSISNSSFEPPHPSPAAPKNNVPLYGTSASKETSKSYSQHLTLHDMEFNYPRNTHKRIILKEEILPYFFQKAFCDPYDPYTEVVTFYATTQKFLSQHKMLDLFQNYCDPSVISIFKAFLCSNGVRNPSDKYWDLFTELEQQYFKSSGIEAEELFEKIITTTGFSYPFNYLDQNILKPLHKKKKEVFKTFVNSLNGKQLAYYNSTEKNLLLASVLSDDKKEEFFLHSLSTLTVSEDIFKSYSNHFLNGNFPTGYQTERIRLLLNNDPAIKELSSVEDVYENLILVKTLSHITLKSFHWTTYNDIQKALIIHNTNSNVLNNHTQKKNLLLFIYLSAMLFFITTVFPQFLSIKKNIPANPPDLGFSIEERLAMDKLEQEQRVKIDFYYTPCFPVNTDVSLSISSINIDDSQITISIRSTDKLELDNFYFNETQIKNINATPNGVELHFDSSLWSDKNYLNYKISSTQDILCPIKEN